MTAAWLIALLIYGAIVGFQQIPTIAWLLCVPFVVQDIHDVRR